jgi:L-ascorbate metabolism protein UlaG (beta-lactamase superfamily)
MKITKLGHCCLLVEENGVRLLTDPGSFTAGKHSVITGLDAVLFTHEHADHFHLQSLHTILQVNPKARVLCNPSVGALLSKEDIRHEVVGDGQSADVKDVTVEGHGATHAVVHSSLPAMENTGFFIARRLWYPGDALSVDPGTAPDILALPTAGPWMKLSEALDYALRLKARSAFPVHDMIQSDLGRGIHARIAASILEPRGVRFFDIELEKEYEF